MDSTAKIFGSLLLAGACTLTALAADDKPSTNAPTAAKTAIAAASTNAPPSTNALANDRVLVKAKGFEIKQSQFDKAFDDLKKEAAAGNQQIPPEELAGVPPKLLNHLILTHLLDVRATEADKAKGKTEAEARIEDLKKQMKGEEMLVMMLKSGGMTLEDLRTQLTTEGISHAVLQRTINVSAAQIKQYYESNAVKFEEPEKVRASHILIGTLDKAGGELSADDKKAKKKVAEGILKRARDGEDFAKLAKEFSDDPGSKDNGGEYTFGRHEMVPEFEAAAFGMTNSQISEIVTTQFGYHIIKLNEKIPGHRVELAKAAADIRDALENEEIEEQLPKLYVQWRKDSNVEILDEKLKALDADYTEKILKATRHADAPPAITPPPVPPVPPK